MFEFLVITFFAIMVLGSIVDAIEKEKIKTLENENRELINKALKDYTKTKGIR
jgi:hypothetical protein